MNETPPAATPTTRAQKLMNRLGGITWAVMVLGTLSHLPPFNSEPGAAQQGDVLFLAVFFLVLLARLVVAMVAQPGRRTGLLILLISIGLWGVASAILNAGGDEALTHFPSPDEGLFLLSYVGLAGYLVTDQAGKRTAPLNAWLEALVVCGGTASAAGVILLSPLSSSLSEHNLPVFIALLYPLIDVSLGLLVLGQFVLRIRDQSASTWQLLGAFALFMAADSQLFLRLVSAGMYYFTVLGDLLWGAGFALIVSAAVSRHRVPPPSASRRRGPIGLLVSGGTAIAVLAVLTVRPHTPISAYLVAPATLTLLFAGARLVRALAEAQHATAAVALSRTDDLTNLPNRRAVLARIDDGLRTEGPLSLMLIDLDRFKEVNDTLGHPVGDRVLQTAADRMRDTLPDDTLLARLGGDEFAVVLATEDEIDLMEMARDIIDAISPPISVSGVELATAASIGITVRTTEDINSGDMLRRADVAMYQAKAARTGALMYDEYGDGFRQEALQLAEELRAAIDAGELTLWYQPQVEAHSGQVVALEALVRWQHPREGILTPVAFLPEARRSGLMQQLSEQVVTMAVADLARWRAAGITQRVSVNCAPPELLTGRFHRHLLDELAAAGIPASSVVVEVTEDAFSTEPSRAQSVLRDMKNRGLGVSIDDFGTGFSSVPQLRDLAVGEVKLDRSLTATMAADRKTSQIVASVITLAHALELRVVAEGVEDGATAAELIAKDIDILQGYHLARPMPAGDVPAWLADWTTFADQFH